MTFGAMSFGSWLESSFAPFGLKGQLAILFLIFFVDALLFPMLPEAFVVVFYQSFPRISTRFSATVDSYVTIAVLLIVVLAAEVLANALLYSLVKWKHERLPRRLSKAMNKWREFLLVSDERVVLLNRIVPIMPFTGAFIAVSPWNPRKAFSYLVLGGALKYGAILAVLGVAASFFDPSQTWWISLGLIVVILAISAISQVVLRKKMRLPETPVANAVVVLEADGKGKQR